MMQHFVIVDSLPLGKYQIKDMADWVSKSCNGKVEYIPSTWSNYTPIYVYPHYKFEFKDDALAFLLKFGGEYKDVLP